MESSSVLRMMPSLTWLTLVPSERPRILPLRTISMAAASSMRPPTRIRPLLSGQLW